MGARRSYSHPRTQLPSSSSSMAANYINPIPDLDDHTPLSGAYIRSLVKQLATSSSSSSTSPPSTPPKTHKKQVRRRLHTTKPYQERLLNMAEARKEIVTALKFHRATMKQQQQQQQQPPPPPEFTEPELVLPSQTLGLNLSSFHDLTNLDATCLYSAPDDITSPASEVALTSPGEADRRQGVGPRALGELEMEEIKHIGEMHEMEWNDTMNLANSAWWFDYLNNMETEQGMGNLSPIEAGTDRQFEEAVELPLYWEGNYGNFYQPRHLELPCMKIEDIEGLDEEWLS